MSDYRAFSLFGSIDPAYIGEADPDKAPAPRARSAARTVALSAAILLVCAALFTTLFFALKNAFFTDPDAPQTPAVPTEAAPATSGAVSRETHAVPSPSSDTTPAATVAVLACDYIELTLSADDTVLGASASGGVSCSHLVGMNAKEAIGRITGDLVDRNALSETNDSMTLYFSCAPEEAYALSRALESEARRVLDDVLPGAKIRVRPVVITENTGEKDLRTMLINHYMCVYGVSETKAAYMFRLKQKIENYDLQWLASLDEDELKNRCARLNVDTRDPDEVEARCVEVILSDAGVKKEDAQFVMTAGGNGDHLQKYAFLSDGFCYIYQIDDLTFGLRFKERFKALSGEETENAVGTLCARFGLNAGDTAECALFYLNSQTVMISVKDRSGRLCTALFDPGTGEMTAATDFDPQQYPDLNAGIR